MKASIIIPAFNEARSVGRVIDDIPMEHVAEIIVVDNGSSDDTAEVARRHGARVVSEQRRGYGSACLRGLASMDRSSDIVVFLDADYSDYPEDLTSILQPILDDEADLVLGSRVMGSREPGALQWNQRLGNALACGLILWLYGTRFTDMGPFRAARRSSFEAMKMSDPTFGWNAEMQVKAIRDRLRIREVPVRYRRRIGSSKISGTIKGTLQAGAKIIGSILLNYPSFVRSRVRGREA